MELFIWELEDTLHQRYNLLHVGEINGQRYNTEEFAYRTADGTCNHPSDDTIGSQGTFLGRNMPPSTSPYGVRDSGYLN